MSKFNKNGLVLWRGRSRIDGSHIVVIATGLKNKSANGKTGVMVQTWILCADIDPIEALRTGKDVAICGGCMHRPSSFNGLKYFLRSCYVNIAQAPLNIWKTWKRERYRVATSLDDVAEAMRGRKVRLGAYGDPAAVPVEVWQACTRYAEGWTGYTHQSRSKKLRDVLEFCQVSADTAGDARAAHVAGVGSFRVLRNGEVPEPFEMRCPASKEAGELTNCASCQACSGWNGANVVIDAHGIGKKAYNAAPKRRSLSLPVINPARAGEVVA